MAKEAPKSGIEIKTAIFTSILLFTLVIFIGFFSAIPISQGGSNMTTMSTVYIDNTEPNITGIEITSVDLVPGSTTQVNCTGYFWDYNGWDDINVTNATLHHLDLSSVDGSDDNNYRYTNTTCSCSQYGTEATNGSCLCTFNVWYYATNGTWMCNMTLGDGEFDSSLNTTTEIGNILGVGLPDAIDFGNMSVAETSAYVPVNISNWGNVPINVSLRGYGGTDESISGVGDLAMMCDLGNISMDYLRYSQNDSTPYSNMINLTNVSTALPDVDLPVRTNDISYANDTNTTYWKLYIPWTTGGRCNGTVEFTGEQIDM
jgi:hypothetical protein